MKNADGQRNDLTKRREIEEERWSSDWTRGSPLGQICTKKNVGYSEECEEEKVKLESLKLES